MAEHNRETQKDYLLITTINFSIKFVPKLQMFSPIAADRAGAIDGAIKNTDKANKL